MIGERKGELEIKKEESGAESWNLWKNLLVRSLTFKELQLAKRRGDSNRADELLLYGWQKQQTTN